MESFTRINVALHGKHFFRVDITHPPEHCSKQIDLLKDRFTKEDGFEVSVTYWTCYGTQVK